MNTTALLRVLAVLILVAMLGAILMLVVQTGPRDGEPANGGGEVVEKTTPEGSGAPVVAPQLPANGPSEGPKPGIRDPKAGIGRRGTPPDGAAVFPDSTWLPPLNGVVSAPPFPGFAPGYPYAPVVEIITGDKGIQWYKHADGTVSNTQMVKREEGGRTWTEAAWVVGNPTKALPVDTGQGTPPVRSPGKGDR